MPKITKKNTVEDGLIIGFVRTSIVGSTAEFEICTVEEWEEMTEEEAEETATTALYESGVFEWWY